MHSKFQQFDSEVLKTRFQSCFLQTHPQLSQPCPSSVRYDLPPAKPSPSTASCPPIPLSALDQEAAPCQPPTLACFSQDNILRPKLKTIVPEIECEKENVDPNDTTGEASEIISEIVTSAIEHVASDEHILVKSDEVDGSECPPPHGYDQAMSLMEEMKDVAFLPGKTFQVNNHEDDYVDQRQVEEYLKQIKVEEDDYVDERQVQEYLKEIELEKKEQTLLDKVSDTVDSEQEEEEIANEEAAPSATKSPIPLTAPVTESETSESEIVPEEVESVAIIPDELPTDSHLESLDTVLASQPYQTGARPKDPSPSPVVYRAPPDYSETDLVCALEPTIPGHVPEPAPYIEEAEYLDLGSLEPTIPG